MPSENHQTSEDGTNPIPLMPIEISIPIHSLTVIQEVIMSGKVPLWVDCDPGHDDAFAIVLAAQHPKLNLLGISTTYGNTTLAHTTDNALSVLTAIKRTDIPVYKGVAQPFCREHHKRASVVDRKSGIKGADLPQPAVGPRTDKHAVVAMHDALLAQPKGTVRLVLLGSFTNIALLMALWPEMADHIKGLVIMGGAIGDKFTDALSDNRPGGGDRVGNSTMWAEFNVFCDPEAAKTIFFNRALNKKTTMIPLDVTHLVLVRGSVLEFLLGEKPHGQTRRIFTDLLRFYRDKYRRIHDIDGPLHDPVAIGAILQEEGLEDLGFEYPGGERFSIDVITEGEQLGRTIARKLPTGYEGVKIPRGLDVSEFWRVLEKALGVSD